MIAMLKFGTMLTVSCLVALQFDSCDWTALEYVVPFMILRHSDLFRSILSSHWSPLRLPASFQAISFC
jgi:hypothetical protein